MKTPRIIHQLVPRGAFQGLGDTPEPKSKKARTPVLPADARRAIAMIKQRPELAERFLFLCETGDRAPETITSACHASQHLIPLLAGHAVEHLGVIFLDRRSRVIAAEVMSIGGSGTAVVDTGVILRRAIVLRAQGLIMGHNHPSGDPMSSPEDIATTRRLQRGAEAIGLRVLDHLIIAGTKFTSLRESGEM